MSIIMNSYERFNAILENRKPDKMPFYFPTVACTVASQILGRDISSGGDSIHFKEELSWLDGENAHSEFVQKYQEDAVELNRKLKADVARQTWRSKAKPSKKLDECTLLFGEENGPHIIKRFFPDLQSYGIVENTTGPKDVDDLKKILLTQMKKDYKVSEDEMYDIYKEQLDFKKLAERYFPTIVGGLGMGIPMDDVVWLEATALEPEVLFDYFIYTAGICVQHVEWLYRQGFRWINGGSDLASRQGPVYSPQFFNNVLVPALKFITDECRKYGMVYCFRTDGNTWSITDSMFNEAGVLAYGEVDRDASMTVGKLKERYPELIILGNNSSSTLHRGTAEEVRRETRAALIESGGTNYIPGPSNAIMHGTPIENIYAMIEEVEKFKP